MHFALCFGMKPEPVLPKDDQKMDSEPKVRTSLDNVLPILFIYALFIAKTLLTIVLVGTLITFGVCTIAHYLSSCKSDEVRCGMVTERKLTPAMDKLQEELECCGIGDFTDWNYMDNMFCGDFTSSYVPNLCTLPTSRLKEAKIAKWALEKGTVVESENVESVSFILSGDQQILVKNCNPQLANLEIIESELEKLLVRNRQTWQNAAFEETNVKEEYSNPI